MSDIDLTPFMELIEAPILAIDRSGSMMGGAHALPIEPVLERIAYRRMAAGRFTIGFSLEVVVLARPLHWRSRSFGGGTDFVSVLDALRSFGPDWKQAIVVTDEPELAAQTGITCKILDVQELTNAVTDTLPDTFTALATAVVACCEEIDELDAQAPGPHAELPQALMQRALDLKYRLDKLDAPSSSVAGLKRELSERLGGPVKPPAALTREQAIELLRLDSGADAKQALAEHFRIRDDELERRFRVTLSDATHGLIERILARSKQVGAEAALDEFREGTEELK